MPRTATPTMHAEIRDGMLVIELPLEDPPRPSTSGKTLVVATSRGNQETDAVVNGQRVRVGCNAYIYRA